MYDAIRFENISTACTIYCVWRRRWNCFSRVRVNVCVSPQAMAPRRRFLVRWWRLGRWYHSIPFLCVLRVSFDVESFENLIVKSHTINEIQNRREARGGRVFVYNRRNELRRWYCKVSNGTRLFALIPPREYVGRANCLFGCHLAAFRYCCVPQPQWGNLYMLTQSKTAPGTQWDEPGVRCWHNGDERNARKQWWRILHNV